MIHYRFIITFIISFSFYSYANLYFPPELISEAGGNVADLGYLNDDGAQPPGIYRVKIFVNDIYVKNKDIMFFRIKSNSKNMKKTIKDKTGLQPCINKNELKEWGVNIEAFTSFTDMKDECIHPADFVGDAYSKFDFNKMRLDISIPQSAMILQYYDWIPPEQWDEGINAAFINYQYSGSRSKQNHENVLYNYLNISEGLNLGAWRFRSNHIWTYNRSIYKSVNTLQHVSSSLQRAIIPLKSQLIVGDNFTNDQMFDSISYRGMSISTDDSMYPSSQRGFSPVIRGIAFSSSSIEIIQNGYVIYRTYVPQGEFTIRDLSTLSASGDLDVIVKENDGHIHSFTVPFSSLPLLQREGKFKYFLATGNLNESALMYNKPKFIQSSLSWGAGYGTTLYGGIQLAENYKSVITGIGANMGNIGAFSIDMTHSDSVMQDMANYRGQILKLNFAKKFDTTGTTFQLVGYRHTMGDYYTLRDSSLKKMNGWYYYGEIMGSSENERKYKQEEYYNILDKGKNKLQVNISQNLGESVSLYVGGSRQTYRKKSAKTDFFQGGLSTSLYGISWNFAASYNKSLYQKKADTLLSLNASFPLEVFLPGYKKLVSRKNPSYVTINGVRNNDGSFTSNTGLYGSLLDEHNLNWSIWQGFNKLSNNHWGGSLQYRGGSGKLTGGYNQNSNFRQLNYGVSGGILLHSEGITFSQALGSENILISAPGASNISVKNYSGSHTDWRGYTVVPGGLVYNRNRIDLDTADFNNDVDVDNSVAIVIPTRGAVVNANFNTIYGHRVLMTLSHKGKPLPFGTIISTDKGRNSIVGDNGEVYLTGLNKSGHLKAIWGNSIETTCNVNYNISNNDFVNPILQVSEICK